MVIYDHSPQNRKQHQAVVISYFRKKSPIKFCSHYTVHSIKYIKKYIIMKYNIKCFSCPAGWYAHGVCGSGSRNDCRFIGDGQYKTLIIESWKKII